MPAEQFGVRAGELRRGRLPGAVDSRQGDICAASVTNHRICSSTVPGTTSTVAAAALGIKGSGHRAATAVRPLRGDRGEAGRLGKHDARHGLATSERNEQSACADRRTETRPPLRPLRCAR